MRANITTILTITSTHSSQFNYANNINLAPLITYLKSVLNPNLIAVPYTYLVIISLAAINSKNLFEGGMHMATRLAFK